MAGKKGKSGGARLGAGAKKKDKRTMSERVKNNYIVAAEKIAEEKGMTIEEHFLRMLFDKNTQDTVKASIMKTYNEALLVKATEQKITKKEIKGPVIGLPPAKEDPAKLIPIDGGKDDSETAKKGNRKTAKK